MHAGARRHRAEVIVARRALPFCAPARRSRRNMGGLDRAPARLHLPHISAADEAKRTMVEIVAVELVDAHADRAGGDERIEVEFVLVEEAEDVGDRLVSEVAADHARVRHRIVRLADARHQEEVNVEDGEGGEDHEVGRLLPFLAARIDKGDAGRAFAGGVDIDAGHLAFGAVAEVGFPDQHRKDRRLRGGFRIVAAAEPFAEAAIGAGPEADAKRVRISLRQVSGGLRERLIAQVPRGLAEQRLAERLRLRRSGIGP